MDRIMSEQAVLDTIADFVKNNDSVAKLILNINAIPSAEPYNGMTNREVLQALFPGAVLHKENDDIYLSFQQGVYLQDRETTWLDAPYKGE